MLAIVAVAYLLRIAATGGWTWSIIIGAVAAITMLIGYRTRTVCVLTWFALLIAVAASNSVPDNLARMIIALLFLSVFVPVGAFYSLDSSMNLQQSAPHQSFSLVSVIVKAELVLIVVVAFVGQLSLSDEFARPSADTLQLAVYISIVIALLPSSLINVLSRWARLVHKDRLRIYYDRDCGFCRKICLIFRTFMMLGETPVIPAQEDAEAYAIMREHDTWVVYDHDGKSYIRWNAVLLLMRRSPILMPVGTLLTAIGMGRWCDWLYGAIASSRRGWSKVTAKLLPYRRVETDFGLPSKLLIVLWLCTVLLFNFSPAFQSFVGNFNNADSVVAGFALNQDWRMP